MQPVGARLDEVTLGRGHAAVVTLTQPARRNCLNLATLNHLDRLLSKTSAHAVLILRGEGPVFCSGLDLREVRAAQAQGLPLRAHLAGLLAVYESLLCHQGRTLCLIQGAALGGGFGLGLCCDVVVAAADARLGAPGGDLSGLAGIVAPLLAARDPRIDPAPSRWTGVECQALTALNRGWIDRVVPPGSLPSAPAPLPETLGLAVLPRAAQSHRPPRETLARIRSWLGPNLPA
jgi:enoyl-CoA hydratase/carnithine racemase